MPFNLTNADGRLRDNPDIEIDFAGTKPIGGKIGTGAIKFQFPPIIKSDSKDLRWEQHLSTYNWEPQYHFKGANPRKISVVMIYVVGGPPIGGLPATGRNISTEIKKIKSYFYIGGKGSGGKLPVFRIKKFYDHIYGGGNSAWRGKDVTVSPSDAVIIDGDSFYPIKIEVTLSFEMATQITTDDGKAKKRHKNLPPKPQKEWY